MLKMRVVTENGQIIGNVTTKFAAAKLPGLTINGIKVGNPRYIAPLNIPDTLSLSAGELEKLGKLHYKITPMGTATEVTATIFGTQYTATGRDALIEVKGKAVSVNGVPKTDENGIRLTSESKTEQAEADKPSASLATLIRNMDIRHQINPLHKAAADNKTDVIKDLIDQQSTAVDCETDRKWTPLHYATFRGHVEATRLLVERGASIEKVNNEGKTPLQHAMSFAVRHQDPESQRKFLEIKSIIDSHIDLQASYSKKKLELSPNH